MWISILLYMAFAISVKGQSSGTNEPLSLTNDIAEETSQAMRKAEENTQKINEEKQKVSKFKTFLKDSIPAYTDQFGNYLK